MQQQDLPATNDLRSRDKANKISPSFDCSSITIEDITGDAKQLSEQSKVLNGNKGLFTVKSANDWIKQAMNRPAPQMLFGEFWFEGELCILFADTNLGKSILAVQIGDSISQGKPISGFKLQKPASKILYFDFELSDKQFENRYSEGFQHHYSFHDNFIRVEVNPDASIPEGQSFEDFLNYSLERSIVETGSRILIIDNLTYLKNETEKAKDALPLMKHLKTLKTRFNLSILALAHTPKRDLTKSITKNDLQGSKMLINFCDSAFTIGESFTDKSIRYVKQIKQRNTEQIYDAENVVTCEIIKPFNFLQFSFKGFATEREHLKQLSEKDRESLVEKAKELSQQGKSQRQIAAELGCSVGAVNKYLKK